jgi:hypothetical protein
MCLRKERAAAFKGLLYYINKHNKKVGFSFD